MATMYALGQQYLPGVSAQIVADENICQVQRLD